MLTILRVIDQHRFRAPGAELPSTIHRDAFKVIYVYAPSVSLLTPPSYHDCSAPMKALAAEIVRKLAKRLRWLSIEVRELTGTSLIGF